jgi:hypothetical protein
MMSEGIGPMRKFERMSESFSAQDDLIHFFKEWAAGRSASFARSLSAGSRVLIQLCFAFIILALLYGVKRHPLFSAEVNGLGVHLDTGEPLKYFQFAGIIRSPFYADMANGLPSSSSLHEISSDRTAIRLRSLSSNNSIWNDHFRQLPVAKVISTDVGNGAVRRRSA